MKMALNQTLMQFQGHLTNNFITNKQIGSMVKCFDLVIVGGGIIGVASAREMKLRYPELSMALVEKESKLAQHQTGHNSGVIHSGIYYRPGTLKAKLCVEGQRLIYEYLDKKLIPYKKCGKLIVATNSLEVKRLEDLYKRAQQNQARNIKVLNNIEEIKQIEPYCGGIKAIWCPETGIVNWSRVTEQLAMDFKTLGGEIYVNYEVKRFSELCGNEYPIRLHGKNTALEARARCVLTCAGLQSDILAHKTGCKRSPQIVPFRGEYLILAKEKQHLVKGNIYPVPDPQFPFLGVHFTPRLDGSVWIGPNAIPALKREGYSWSDVNIVELFHLLRYPGFHKLSRKYFQFGLREIWRSIYPVIQVEELQNLLPGLTEYDIQRGPAGVRAQALSSSGKLVDDFIFDHGTDDTLLSERILHCRNAPSPGATSSLAIAKSISDKIVKKFTFLQINAKKDY